MQRACVETLPSLKITNNLVAQRATSRNDPSLYSGSLSLASTPETPCILPQVSRYPRCIKRINGYVHKTYAYGSPEIVRKIFTGKLTPSYFNDVCYGRKQTPQEFRFDTPIERVKPLWEPKQVSRDTKRHVLQKIEDARYRKQSMLEKASIKKEKERMRRSEAALLRESEQMSRGVTAYLVKLERQKQKYDAKIAARKEKRKSIVE